MHFRKMALGAIAGLAIAGSAILSSGCASDFTESHYYGLATQDVQVYKDPNLKNHEGTLPKGTFFERLGYGENADKIIVNGTEYWMPDESKWLLVPDSYKSIYHGDAIQFLFDAFAHRYQARGPINMEKSLIANALAEIAESDKDKIRASEFFNRMLNSEYFCSDKEHALGGLSDLYKKGSKQAGDYVIGALSAARRGELRCVAGESRSQFNAPIYDNMVLSITREAEKLGLLK